MESIYLEITDNVVTQAFSYTEEHAPVGWVKAPDSYEIGWSYIDGIVSANYKVDRERTYPTVSEQLDMQYWDNIDGTTVWKDTITSIKEQFPKEVINNG